MPQIRPVTFAGYEIIPGVSPESTRARIFTPGEEELLHPLQAEVVYPDQKSTNTIPLQYDAGTQMWKSTELLPLGTEYRIDSPELRRIEARTQEWDSSHSLTLQREQDGWQSRRAVSPGTTVYIPLKGLPPVEVEAVFPDHGASPLTPRLEGNQWVITVNPEWQDEVFIRVKPAPDWVETVERNGRKFNRISSLDASAPSKNGPMVDIFLDSLLPLDELARLAGMPADKLRTSSPKERKQLAEQIRQNSDILPARNHFNRYGGNEAGLEELLPLFHRVGIRSVLTKPFIGGDNLSSHRYWTVDPFVLNNSFSSKQAFQRFLNSALDNGMKLYNDGAFVTQGLNGAQFLSLIGDRQNSPYWHWFTHTETVNRQRIDHTGKLTFPRLTQEEMTLGVLPTKLLSNGHRVLDYNHFDFRIINNPSTWDYDSRKPTWIELYDPTTQTSDGQPLRAKRPILNSEDSVQNYRFPVSVEELAAKRKLIGELKPNEVERKRLLTEWKRFRLKEASSDDSTYKWDGQTNVAKMNTKNPEVIAYLRDAVQYWTRFVSNTYTDRVARALQQTRIENPNDAPETLIQRITNPTGRPSAAYALPAVELPAQETLSFAEIKQALQPKPPIPSGSVFQTLANTLLNDYPLMALELPINFKSRLSCPDLSDLLKGTSTHPFQKFWRENVLHGMSQVPGLDTSFESFEQGLAKKLEKAGTQLSPASREKLRDPRLQALVLDPLAELLYMRIFTDLDLSDPNIVQNLTPQQVEDALYDTVPGSIIRNNPISASKLLPGFMKQRLNQIPDGTLTELLEDRLHGLDSSSVALAKAVLNKREFGLNWRLDAAKDVADIDRVFDAEPEDRPWLFQEEMQFVRKFWGTLNEAIHKEFPKSSIIAELTDFELLSNDRIAQQEMAKTLGSGHINGMPNMSFLFSTLVEAVSHSQRPDEHGGKTISPSKFLLHAAKLSAQTFPNATLQNNQNFTSSHDYLSTAHALLLNTDIWTMDHLRWWGLADDMREACNELLSKPCFEAQRAQLDVQVPEWRKAVSKIADRMQKVDMEKNWNRSEKLRNRLTDPAHRQYFNEASKSNADGMLLLELSKRSPQQIEQLFSVIPTHALDLEPYQLELLKSVLQQGYPKSGKDAEILEQLREIPQLRHALFQLRQVVESPEIHQQLSRAVVEAFRVTRESPQYTATPFELKGSFVDDLLTYALPPHELGMNAKESAALKQALRTRMTEHSEDRAMRALIMNNWLRFTEDGNSPWNRLMAPYRLFSKPAPLKQAFTQSLWDALDKTIREYPRQFGYQPLDTALDNVFKNMDSEWQKALPKRIQQDPARVQAFVKNIQESLYQQANLPVVDKLLRIFALQCGMPGNPSVYLHDLFVQSGGEWVKNAFVQDRSVIRTDRLETERWLQSFLNAASAIFGQRGKLSALTNGQLIPISADDENGVIPLVRDNGQDQVIVLVNTGKPKAPEWEQGKVDTTERYPEILPTAPQLKDYKLNLSELHVRPGTVYRDVNTGERFRINEEKQLVNARGKGMDLGICRILQRENSSVQLQG